MEVSGKTRPNNSLYTTAVVPLLVLWALTFVLLVTTGVLQLRALDAQTQLHSIETARQIRDHALDAVHIQSDNRLTLEFAEFIDEIVRVTPGTTVTLINANGQLLYGNTAKFEDGTHRAETTVLIARGDQVAGKVRVITDRADQYQLLLRRYVGVAAALIIFGFYLLWRLRARFKKFRHSTAELTAAVSALEHGSYAPLPDVTGPSEIMVIYRRIAALAQALRAAQQERDERVTSTREELNKTLEEIEIKNVELDLARKRAEQENAAKSSFLANISHEIRSPMNGIIGHLQLLQRMPGSDQQQSFIDNSLFAAHALLDLIDNTLHFSRIEAGRLDIQNEPFSLLNEIHRCLIMLAPDASRKKLDLYFWSDPSLPLVFIGDSLRIRQIVTNLISNAIKYTNTGSIHLRISGVSKPGNKCALSIDVADTGLGMSSAQIESLFEEYSQAGRSAEGGSGLGLVITRSLTEAMGGQLNLSSIKHQGSVFSVQLTMPYQHSIVPPTIPGPAAARVLLDCQDAATRSYYAELLEFNGYIVTDKNSQAADIGLRVWTNAQIDQQLRDGPDVVDAYRHSPMPQVILAGRDEFTLMPPLNRPAGCEVLPLHSQPRLVIAALERLLNQNLQAPPDLQEDGSASPPTGQSPDSVAVPAHVLEGLRVLLADDDEFGRAYMSELLKQHGMSVDQCADGLAAIGQARMATYDLVLLDLRMPGCDGIEVARRIREFAHTDSTPIIGMTASVSPELHQQCFNAGMTDCWVKPLQIPTLINGLRYWIQSGKDQIFPGSLPQAFLQDNDNKPVLDYQMRDLLLAEFDRFEARYNGGWQASVDIAGLGESAHRLNGSAAICRLSAVQQAAGLVEKCARDGATEKLPQALDNLLSAVAKARDTLGNAAA